MPKKVHNKVIDHRMLDDDQVIEDVTSVTMPDVAFSTDEFDPAGIAAAVEMVDATHVDAMTFSVAHNNGNNCERLSEPRKHKFEFRLAQQYLDTAQGATGGRSIKYRIWGYPKKVSDGTIERGNPIGSTIDYSVLRYEKEIDGKTTLLIDVMANIVQINGKNYSSQIQSLLD